MLFQKTHLKLPENYYIQDKKRFLHLLLDFFFYVFEFGIKKNLRNTLKRQKFVFFVDLCNF